MKNQLSLDIKLGDTALVMCVKVEIYQRKRGDYINFDAVPILPYEPHEDSEILDFSAYHYHYDWRF